jgi:hypothetical protein
MVIRTRLDDKEEFMMMDYKEQAQLRAEALAYRDYGKDFGSLTEFEKVALYDAALDEVLDELAERAEMASDQKQDR